jgi:FAD/FMN-containing dehydrogenase
MTPPDVGIQRPHTNFGGNQTWFARSYRPRNEAEVLEILARHRHGHIRVAGGRGIRGATRRRATTCASTWGSSTTCRCRRATAVVRVGGGCTIQRLLEQLHTRSGRTLPTMGVIKKQTIAGAISTGTHGSGSQSPLPLRATRASRGVRREG